MSRKRNFISVERSAGLSDGQFQTMLEEICRGVGGILQPEFRYVLESEPTFDAAFDIKGTVPRATLDDVLVRIGANRIHNSPHRGAGVAIAVVDTGVNGGRLEFPTDKRLNGWAPEGEDPWTDYLGHGTMCAAIAAATRAYGGRFEGVAPDAQIISCRTTFADGELIPIYDHLIELAKSGTKVIATNSFGIRSGRRPKIPKPHRLSAVLDEAIEAGVHVVFSAGNNHDLAGGEPENCRPNTIWLHKSRADVMTVGTCDLEDKMWFYSSRGPGQFIRKPNMSPKPDVVAPTPRDGLIIHGDGEIVAPYGWGTSGAAPQVAGLLALLLSARPDLPRDELFDIVRSTAVDLGFGRTCQGSGRIDCGEAMDRLTTI